MNESFLTVSPWASGLGLTYPILLDGSYKVWDQYGMGYIPHNVLIDPDMVVRYTNYGYDITIKSTLVDLIEQYGAGNTSVDSEPVNTQSKSYKLLTNYPNPFNAQTRITYDVPGENDVSLIVFDINGQWVQTLVQDHSAAGTYSVEFNGEQLHSGVYFCELIIGSQREIRKMVLLK